MRIISRKRLIQFWERYPDAEQPLRAWYAEAKKANWKTPIEVKAVYRNASILANNRVVFNIKGNDYRLVVVVEYRQGKIFIRFVGTHAEYNGIDATTIYVGGGMMDIKPIRAEEDYQAALKEIEVLWGAEPGTPEEDRCEVLFTLVEAYEHEHYEILPPDPVEAIKYYLESRGLERRDLEPYLGSSGRVSEVLSYKRPLTLRMIRKLHAGLGIPSDVLINKP